MLTGVTYFGSWPMAILMFLSNILYNTKRTKRMSKLEFLAACDIIIVEWGICPHLRVDMIFLRHRLEENQTHIYEIHVYSSHVYCTALVTKCSIRVTNRC
jgi:hypothetical protein